jgi:hypothetical protein
VRYISDFEIFCLNTTDNNKNLKPKLLLYQLLKFPLPNNAFPSPCYWINNSFASCHSLPCDDVVRSIKCFSTLCSSLSMFLLCHYNRPFPHSSYTSRVFTLHWNSILPMFYNFGPCMTFALLLYWCGFCCLLWESTVLILCCISLLTSCYLLSDPPSSLHLGNHSNETLNSIDSKV